MVKNSFKIRNRKIFIMIILLFFIGMFSIRNFSYAEELENIQNINEVFDVEEKEEIYKVSEDNKIYLPFFRLTYDRAEIDKEISNFGLICANNGIDVNSKMQDLQILLSNDTVRVNDSMEYAVIFSTGNVIINSNIDKTLFVFAGEKVTLTENSNIKGDVICFANSLEVQGTIEGSIVGSATNSIISGHINKDFRLATESVEISGNNNVAGNVFIETTNSSIDLSEMYPEAKIKLVKKTTTFDLTNFIIGVIKTSLVYTLAYILVFKLFKEKLFKNLLNTTMKNVGFTIFTGAISILAIPLIITIAFLGIFIGLEEIIIPLIILYIAFVLVVSLLSTFIVGGLVHEFIKNKYLKDLNITKNIVVSFFVFLVMVLLTNIPKIGVYINMLFMIVAIGSIIAIIFKGKKSINSQSKK